MAFDVRALGQAYTKHWEGCSLTSYPDAGGFSIGYGHHSSAIAKGMVWIQAQADQAFADDWASAMIEAGNSLSQAGWNNLGAARQAVLIDMAYELGFGGLREFVKMRQALETGAWGDAAAQALLSKAERQVPERWECHALIFSLGDAAIVDGALPTSAAPPLN